MVPLYYDRDEKGIPHKWLAMVKHAFHSAITDFSAHRMVWEYLEKYYMPAIKRSERYADAGSMSYEIPLPPGDYQVRLHFAELFYTSAGARIFDVDIEGGQGQLSNYDIFIRAGGANIAVVETFMITVNDGGLSIAFGSQVE